MSQAKWERRRFCSPRCGNKGKDSSHLKKYVFQKGVSGSPKTQFKKGQTVGKNNVKWKGDKASYAALHLWVKYHFGSPQECEHCGTTEKRMYHWANLSRQFKRERSDWIRLCVPCHKRFDLVRLKERNSMKKPYKPTNQAPKQKPTNQADSKGKVKSGEKYLKGQFNNLQKTVDSNSPYGAQTR